MASGVNDCTFIGNMVRDPELRETNSGKSVCNFTLAINFKKGGEEDVMFLPMVAWERGGELINEYVSKGDALYVRGRLQINEWTDKEGNERKTPEVSVNEFKFLPRSGDAVAKDTSETPDV